jgi:hypothetical protein
MEKKFVYIFLGVVAVIIIAVIASDILGSRPDKRGENPFALNVDEYTVVDPALIKFREARNIKLEGAEYRGIDISGDSIFLIGDDFLQIIDPAGRELLKFQLPESPRAVHVRDNEIFVSFLNYISSFTRDGELQLEFKPVGDSAVITSLAVVNGYLYAADAGNRQVLRYSLDGELLDSFQGKREADDLHGFIIPSPNFDLVNNFDELWVVNPGMHTLENYTEDGDLRGYWENTSMTIEGFGGCCNPAHVAVMPNGYFVTSEKGIVRIKIYEMSGKFNCVVAAPDKFNNDGHAPDIDVSGSGEYMRLILTGI